MGVIFVIIKTPHNTAFPVTSICAAGLLEMLLYFSSFLLRYRL
jgi:hypothetical protein